MDTLKVGRRRVLLMAFLSGVSAPSMALAQASIPSAAPVSETIDDHFVDLASGAIRVPIKSISIGDPSNGGLTFNHYYGKPSSIDGLITSNGNLYTVTIDGDGEAFTESGGLFQPVVANGSTLVREASNNRYVYRRGDGALAYFTFGYGGGPYPLTSGGRDPQPVAPPSTTAGITYYKQPSGSSRTYYWDTGDANPGQQYAPNYRSTRLREVRTSTGYQAQFTYQAPPSGTSSLTANGIWTHRLKVVLLNTARDCPNAAASCNTVDRPFLTFSSIPTGAPPSATDVNDASGGLTTINESSGSVTIQPPGSVPALTYTLSSGRVTASTIAGVTATYTYGGQSGTSTTTRVTPAGTENYAFTSTTLQLKQYSTDPQHVTTYQYNNLNQLIAVIMPEGDQTQYVPDGRGNVTQTKLVSKTGAVISTSASYPGTCANVVTCNLPTSTTNAASQVTNYEYDPDSGLPVKVTAPAPAINTVRPEVRYTYAQYGGVTKLVSISTCRTLASCAGGADEVKTSIVYGTLAENNFLPKSVTTGSGDNLVTATTAYTYNAMGDVDTVDGPRSDVTDTVRILYNTPLRRPIGQIGPDPDGTGPRRPQATRLTYDSAGRVEKAEAGNVDGQADSQWSSFTPAQQLVTSFDPNGAKVKQVTSAGGSTTSVVQYSYDTAGRLLCTAQRMDPAQWNGQADACTPQTNGTQGPDRVTRVAEYDIFGRILQLTTAFGTAEASTEKTSFTRNGKVATVTDANNNVTSYGYDDFDRPSTTSFSDGSYEQVGYDPAGVGNVVSRRLRDGQTLAYSYDALNRRTYDDNPNTNVAEVDRMYTYDNLGHVTRASDQNGWFAAFEYDALERTTRQYSNLSSNTLQYDPAGNLTRQTWADGFYVTYAYDAAGAMTVVRENGSLALATFAYDDLGRRTSLTRGNGTATNYGYDATLRLGSLTQDLAGTARDLTLSFGYNPAGQITSRTSSNDAYAWTGAVNVDRGYTVNGLNQYTQSGPVTLAYDGRGNLTGAGNGVTYGYNTRNELFTNNAGQLFYRNPAGLLNHIVANNTVTNLDYVGANLATEFDGNNGQVKRRYVFGPGGDEALVWYEGSGTGDRRYLHADERGSVVAVSDNAGNATAINSYDEYGIPGAGNQGRFQYTGQKWISELGLYDYKARMYSPTLGRFLQTDPIGYDDGMNWYNYTGGDPVNFTDPSGLADRAIECIGLSATETAICQKASAMNLGQAQKEAFCNEHPAACTVQVSAPSEKKPQSPERPSSTPQGARAPQFARVPGSNAGLPQNNQPPICNRTQATAQILGMSAVNVGTKATKAGDGLATVGGLTAAASALRVVLAPAGVLIGGEIVAAGATLGTAGRLLTGVGGVTAIAGGASIRSVGAKVLVNMAPLGFLYRDAATKYVNKALDYLGVPDRPGCVIK